LRSAARRDEIAPETATDIGLIAAVQTVARVAFLLIGGVEAVLAVLLLTGHAATGRSAWVAFDAASFFVCRAANVMAGIGPARAVPG
jgi:hypothetical protein